MPYLGILRIVKHLILIEHHSIYRSNKEDLLSMEKCKKVIKKNKFKISAPKQTEEFELSERSYSVSDLQYNFEYILKAATDNP